MNEPVNFGDFWDQLCHQAPNIDRHLPGYPTKIGLVKLIMSFATPTLHAKVMLAAQEPGVWIPQSMKLNALIEESGKKSSLLTAKEILDAAVNYGKVAKLHRSCRRYRDPKLTLAYCSLAGWPTVIRGRVVIPINPDQVIDIIRWKRRPGLFERLRLRRRERSEGHPSLGSPDHPNPPPEPYPHVGRWRDRIEGGVQRGVPAGGRAAPAPEGHVLGTEAMLRPPSPPSSSVPLNPQEEQHQESVVFDVADLPQTNVVLPSDRTRDEGADQQRDSPIPF